MQITYTCTNKPPRKKPQAGDTKVVKGVTYIRQQVILKHHPYKGCHQVSNGRPVYEWVEKGGANDRSNR